MAQVPIEMSVAQAEVMFNIRITDAPMPKLTVAHQRRGCASMVEPTLAPGMAQNSCSNRAGTGLGLAGRSRQRGFGPKRAEGRPGFPRAFPVDRLYGPSGGRSFAHDAYG